MEKDYVMGVDFLEIVLHEAYFPFRTMDINCFVSTLHSSICTLLEIIFEIIFSESDREMTYASLTLIEKPFLTYSANA